MPPGYFGAASRNDGYFGTIKKMLYEDTIARVHRQENGTTFIVDIDIRQLETLMPKKQVSNETPRCSKGKFNLRIKPACPLLDLTDDEDADGDPDADFQKQALSSIPSKIFCLKYL